MRNLKSLLGLLSKKPSDPSPLLIIKKSSGDANVKEYRSIDEAIDDLEKDPNVSPAKIEKLKTALKNLKNKNSIRIRNGELVK